jgi:hypothetical protein
MDAICDEKAQAYLIIEISTCDKIHMLYTYWIHSCCSLSLSIVTQILLYTNYMRDILSCQ